MISSEENAPVVCRFSFHQKYGYIASFYSFDVSHNSGEEH